MEKLAIHGGAAMAAGKFTIDPWPPVSAETAEKIRELYFSREWSFNSRLEQEFEKRYAEYHDAEYGIFMANGTVTLECALEALGVGKGDEVIVPALTWIATAAAVNYVGAKVVFADIDPATAGLDSASFEANITPRTKAVIPVHLYGSMADLDKILAIARRHGIAVIEDCAHMQGGKWNGRGVGSWSDIGSFSFQQSKTLSSGEGGICLTSDPKLADRLYRAKHIGYSRYDKQGQAATPPPEDLVCHNYRGLAVSAQILLDQLPGLPERLEHYNAFVRRLGELTSGIPGFRIQTPGRLASPQGFYAAALIFEGEDWDRIGKKRIYEAVNAECGPQWLLADNYGPVYRHLLFNMRPDEYRNTDCPVTEALSDRMLLLLHWKMYHVENAELLAGVIHKVHENRNFFS